MYYLGYKIRDNNDKRTTSANISGQIVAQESGDKEHAFLEELAVPSVLRGPAIRFLEQPELR